MQLFLFLDDWMLDEYQNIVRGFPRPTPAPVPFWEDAPVHSSVYRDPESGTYRCWYARIPSLDDKLVALCLAESSDGYHWHRCTHGGPTDPRYPDLPNAVRLPRRPDGSWCVARVVFRDDHDEDPSRRYKAVDAYGWLLLSPDGINWRLDQKYRAFRKASDALNNIFWNPPNGRYQLHHRPVVLDRRINLSESTDLVNWVDRGIVLQADAQDPPLMQIYSMQVFWYEDLFIALPDLWRAAATETGGRAKMLGHDQVGFAYSYNGTYWLRPYREPFLPVTEPGTYGSGTHSPGCIVLGHDEVLRVYSHGYRPHHGERPGWRDYVSRGEPFGAMLMHTLRKDGFAYLEPMAGWGWLRTRVVIPQNGDLRLNVQAPLGQVLVQVSDEFDHPIPGFTFEDCVPFHGDGLAVRPQWKEHSLEDLMGRPCRLEVKLFSARLYAFRWQCQAYYGKEPQDRI